MAGLIATEAGVDNALIDFATIIEHELDCGTEITNDIVTDVDALLAATTFPGSEPIRAAAVNARVGFANFIRDAATIGYTSLMRAYLRVAGYPNLTWPSPLGHRRLRDWWIGASKLLQTRTLSFDTTANQAGTGNPTVRRLTVDEDGYTLEAVWPTTTYIEVLSSQPETQVGQETLNLYTKAGIDLFSQRIADEENGDGVATPVTLENSDNSYLSGHSFGFGLAATGAPTSAAPWTDNAGDFITSVTVVDQGYRQSVEERAAFLSGQTNMEKPCLNVTDDIDISRALSNISLTEAYDGGFWVKRTGTITGNIILDVGAITVTQNIASLTLNTWTFVGLPLTANNWGRNIATDNPKFRIYTSSLSISSGNLYVDASTFKQLPWHNGTKWHIQPGPTPIGEDFTDDYTDSMTDSVVARHLAFCFGPEYMLPSGSPSTRLSEAGI